MHPFGNKWVHNLKVNAQDTIAVLAKEKGILRPRDLAQLGIAATNLNHMAAKGLLSRVGRGLYTLPDHEWTEHHSLAEVAKAVPNGVICLLSALRFHEIGTQSPFEVWVAIPRDKARPARMRSVQLRTVKFSEAMYSQGIEMHSIEGTEVRVYNIAKTVVDCWRFRNKIGKEIPLEALREVLSKRKLSLDDLRRYGESARVWNVMSPYVEAMV